MLTPAFMISLWYAWGNNKSDETFSNCVKENVFQVWFSSGKKTLKVFSPSESIVLGKGYDKFWMIYFTRSRTFCPRNSWQVWSH